ncbi:efflux RND transporter periplasmic adaptor subunit [Ramlibacter sp. MMS24-I3-19]|uniref:efflux RND transporter periplasmic adaptor subunit n=1 Tax=Ramlibacter sp. MMS24-I3-19 TaxID=3416606 RepID=UPI003D0329F8
MAAPTPHDPAPHSTTSDSAPRRYGRRGFWLGTLIALLVIGGLGWAAWHYTRPEATQAASSAGGGGGPGGGGPGGGGPGARGGPPTTVGVAVAERSDLSVTLEALGTVTPLATAKVRPQVSGPLLQVAYQEGQMVKKGDLLAVIDPRPFEMAVQQASGARMRDEAQLEAARVTLKRYQTLLQQDSIARQDVDTQAATVKQLEAAVVVDKANEGTARLNLSYTRITAPLAGRLGLRQVDVGNVVSGSDANGVAVITQLSPIDVQFSIPQDQVGALQGGGKAPMPAKALDRTRSQVLDTGTFLSLDNQVDAATGTVKAKARFSNTQGNLFPSQFVNVQLQLRTLQGATTVPVAAVRQGPNGDQVFVINPDRTVTLRLVQRGQSTVDKVQIVKGLQPGERVVTEGADRLRDGSRVLLPGDAPASGRRNGAAGAPGARAPQDGPAVAPGTSASAAQQSVKQQAAPQQNPSSQQASASAGPSPDQRQRMLDSVKDDPEQLARRKQFLEAIDKGDPQALQRWQQMQQRRAGGTQQQ